MGCRKLILLSCSVIFLIFSVESKGIAFVVDTAQSMNDEISYLKMGLQDFTTNSASLISNYVVVPFNEPDIGPVTVSKYAQHFEMAINNLSGRGARDCPDISVEALHRALETSAYKSNVYFFTDAYTEDFNGINSIKDLCRNTSSHITIILTRSCSPSNPGYETISHYQDITDACGGQLIIMSPYNLRYVFKYIQHQLQWNEDDFYTDESIACDNREHTVSIDAPKALIQISGNVRHSTIRDDSAKTNVELIMSSKIFKAYLITNPKNVRLTCSGVGKVTIKIGTKTSFPFALGFSRYKPTIMKETATKPLPNLNSYVLVSPLDRLLTPVSIEIISSVDKDNKRQLALSETLPGIRLYVGGEFSPPSDKFKIMITYNTYGKTELSKTFADWEVQKLVTPKYTRLVAEIIQIYPVDVDYGEEITLACKVTGYPRPSIWWEDEFRTRYKSVDDVLELPNVFISYANIKNITRDNTYYCYTNNGKESDYRTTRVKVNITRKFEVIKKPRDNTINIGMEAVIDCKVDAMPKATVKWYFNNTELIFKGNVDIDEDKLVIRNMDLDDVGLYTCEVTNSFENQRFDAKIHITGLETPTVSMESDNIQLKVGDPFTISCGAKGKPQPKITWKHKKSELDDWEELPYDVSSYGDDLTIDDVKTQHHGIYRCEASSDIGSAFGDVVVQVGAKPVIEEGPSSVTATIYDLIALPCRIISDTNVHVRWILVKNGVETPLSEHMEVDGEYTLRFATQMDDDGEYICTAENEIGVTERRVTVNVLVPPYIQSRSPKIIKVKTGTDISIPCEILYGNPPPTMSWVFIPNNSTKQEVLSADSSNELHLTKVTSANVGEYICSATNQVGYDAIKVLLRLS